MTAITKSTIIGNEMDFHRVVATLSDGRTVEFKNANLGHADYPHIGTGVHVFESDHVEGGVTVFHAGDVELLDRTGQMVVGRGGKIIGA